MSTKTVEMGTRVSIRVDAVFPGRSPLRPQAVIGGGDSGEGYAIAGVTHDVEPRVGDRLTLEFTPGGRFGGHWKAIAREKGREN